MRILYIIKGNPKTSVGHAADRARNFLTQLKLQGHEVECIFPDETLRPRNILEKINGLTKSYHQRSAGQKFTDHISQVIFENNFDVIISEELSPTGFALKALNPKKVPIVYVAHNVESDLYKQIVQSHIIEKWRLENLIKFEKNVIQHADIIFSFSEEDRNRLVQMSGGKKIHLTRAGVELLKTNPAEPSLKDKVLFVGALDYFPNIQALQWYSDHVHPLVKIKYQLLVAGRNPGPKVKEICEKNGFTLISSPVKMQPILEQGILEIVPLLSGSGTRGKILEAASCNIPVLSTTLGAAGLGFIHQNNIVLADHPKDFANELENLLNQPERAHSISINAKEYVKYFYYEEVVKDFMRELISLK